MMGFLVLSSGNKKPVVLQHLLETQKRMEGSNPVHLRELFFMVQHHYSLEVLAILKSKSDLGE